jgi:hypothetical protein
MGDQDAARDGDQLATSPSVQKKRVGQEQSAAHGNNRLVLKLETGKIVH